MKTLLALLAFSALALAQPIQQVSVPPDCQIFFSFTAAGQTSPLTNNGLDNRTQGCTTWNFYYVNSGFSALEIRLQSAANNAGVPGAYSTGFPVQQTIITGTNPGTNTTGGFVWLTGTNAWVRVLLFSVTGTGVVNGALYGWRIPAASANGSGGVATNVNVADWGGVATTLGQKHMASSVPVTIADDQSAIPVTTTPSGTQDVNLTKVAGTAVNNGGLAGAQGVGGLAAAGAAAAGNPIQAGGVDGSGNAQPIATNSKGNELTGSMCTNQALFNLSGSGDTRIVTGSMGLSIRICHISFSTVGSEDVKLTVGTGATCSSSTADLTGLYKSVVAIALDPLGSIVAGAGLDLCLNQSVGQALGGIVTYALF